MTPLDGLLVGAAGLVAGAVNAVAGGGTLVSFPALLAAGLPPVTASITSSVGLVPGYLGGSIAYRHELHDQRGRVRTLVPLAAAGGVAGALLLLATSQDAFRAVVPFLVLISCALLAAQPRLTAALAGRQPETRDVPWSARVAVGAGGVYGSYFGAGLGVLLLAVLGTLVPDDLQRSNALKGLLSLVVNVTGVLVFVVAGGVAWQYAGLLALTAYAGGTLGVGLARRLPAPVMRTAVIGLGVLVAVVLLVRG